MRQTMVTDVPFRFLKTVFVRKARIGKRISQARSVREETVRIKITVTSINSNSAMMTSALLAIRLNS